jgi:predicted transcriptional regulator
MHLSDLQLKLWHLMSADDRRSIRELCEAAGASSTSIVRYNLLRLADLGILQPPPHGQARMWRCLRPYEEASHG